VNNCDSSGCNKRVQPSTSISTADRSLRPSPSRSGKVAPAPSPANWQPGSWSRTSRTIPPYDRRTRNRSPVPGAASPLSDGPPLEKPFPGGSSSAPPGKSPSVANSGIAGSAGSLFFPLDHKLRLGTEGYSPSLIRKAVRQASKAASFKEASEDLKELAGFAISATHLQRVTERIGGEWEQQRDAEIQAFQEDRLARSYEKAPRVAAVMLDGGRYQTRAAEAGRGVTEPGWREDKVACCQTYASQESKSDPQPQPPSKFLDRQRVTRLAAELRSRSGRSVNRAETTASKPSTKRSRRRSDPRKRPQRLVRTVVATTAANEEFGWQVAAEVHRRGLDKAKRKCCLGDGSKTIWALFEFHLLAAGFIGILDFLHLLAHLYAGACAAEGKGTEAAWALYTQWLCWAWAGKVVLLLGALRAVCQRLGEAPAEAPEEDPRRVAAETLTYVENNRGRMNYPEYRRLGLPISSAPVESVIKQLNRRVKGTEKFWLEQGAEAVLQVRAAYLSEDGRAERYWRQPRPHRRAVGSGRLRRPAATSQ
jgi:hypothetical protein